MWSIINKDQVNDVIFEALFRQAVIDDFNEEIDSIPTNEQLAKIYSIFIIVLGLLFGTLFFNIEVRAAVGKVLVEWYEKVWSARPYYKYGVYK